MPDCDQRGRDRAGGVLVGARGWALRGPHRCWTRTSGPDTAQNLSQGSSRGARRLLGEPVPVRVSAIPVGVAPG